MHAHFCLNVHHAEELPACVGLGAVASYGAISNITYGGGLAVAWIGFVRQFSKSPLMEGQWKAFLAFYAGMLIMLYPRYADPASFSAAFSAACSGCQQRSNTCMSWCDLCDVHQVRHAVCYLSAGFWTIQNFVRPLRFSLALALAPLFERFLNTVSRTTGFSKRNAFGVYLFILGTVTSTLVFGSIFIFAGPLAYAKG